jgi:Zn-dependent M32 family carboxypeptidase
VHEATERARDMLLYKDMQRHESEMRLIEKQMPQAKAFYDAQSPEVKARIDQRIDGTQPYYRDKAFVGEVLREMNRKNRQILTSPQQAPAMAAG